MAGSSGFANGDESARPTQGLVNAVVTAVSGFWIVVC
jgi:hypothetical protein